MEMPARVARRKPDCSSLSAKTTVSFRPHLRKDGVDQPRDFLLLQRLVDVAEGQALGQDLRQQRTADGGGDQLGFRLEVAISVLGPFDQADVDLGGDLDGGVVQRTLEFHHVGEDHAFALAVDALAGGVVQAQHHVLRRHDGRLARGREQHVVGGQHQRAGFHLRFDRQRHVDGHLVTVEVGVEGGADQRVQLDGLAFDQHRLKRLDAQAVQRRRPVQHDRVFLDDLFQDVPDHRRAGFNFLLRRLDGGGDAHGFQAREDEGLEQLQRHQLGAGRTGAASASGRPR